MSIICHFGIHKWRSIRKTHYNSWMGSICERCGAAQHTYARVMHQSLTGEKKNLDDFYRVAGGNKPMPYDKRPAEEPQFHTEITTPNQETHIPI